ncbi:MAG: hypothetical protein AAF191_01940, partial [Verrucomicrobiota bacterium]
LEPCDVEVMQVYADYVYVRGPLQEGDWVLASGLQKVAPGQRVQATEVRPGLTANQIPAQSDSL